MSSNENINTETPLKQMKIIYRISDGEHNKLKPDYVTKRGCFLHFIKIFQGYTIYVIADNIKDETYMFLCQYLPPQHIIRSELNGSMTFLLAVELSITNFKDDDVVFFPEDDYIYTPDAPKILEEGIELADYCTGYDHPDKYVNSNEEGGNPFVTNGGETTRVIISKSSHWKYTNSSCMTFVTRVRTMKEDFDMYKKFCIGYSHPVDFIMWLEIISINKRKLISSIPAVCTHGEKKLLSPFVDWEKMFHSNLMQNNII